MPHLNIVYYTDPSTGYRHVQLVYPGLLNTLFSGIDYNHDLRIVTVPERLTPLALSVNTYAAALNDGIEFTAAVEAQYQPGKQPAVETFTYRVRRPTMTTADHRVIAGGVTADTTYDNATGLVTIQPRTAWTLSWDTWKYVTNTRFVELLRSF